MSKNQETVRKQHDDKATYIGLRPPSKVMDLNRLGVNFANRLSFAQTLIRHMSREKWQIGYSRFHLDEQGYGHAVFNIKTPNNLFSFVIFSQYLAHEDRNDRVLAEKWDLTATLIEGSLDDATLAKLEANVPLQEAGRLDSRSIVLSRANRSSRIFNEVLTRLRSGEQPDTQHLAEVGYLYRTTAVYGSGKFGCCDWEKVLTKYPDLARPFAAEMLVCYLLRQFSLDQIHHMVCQDVYPHATNMHTNLQRYFGIGNSTGLGMAPWLVNHPEVFAQWVLQRETALATLLQTRVTKTKLTQLQTLVSLACQHIQCIQTADERQASNNLIVLADLTALQNWLCTSSSTIKLFRKIYAHAEQHYSMETQELLVSLFLELYPELTEHLEDQMHIQESLQYDPTTEIATLLDALQQNYDWAFTYNFGDPKQTETFWYYSQCKSEPRIGKVGTDEGVDLQMFLGIAQAVQKCYQDILFMLSTHERATIADFTLLFPEHQAIVARIYTMSQTYYGEIRANLLDSNVRPIHLLRGKLAFFGASKFDPKSDLWVRNTMFQGAPLVTDLASGTDTDWIFPTVVPFDVHHQKQQRTDTNDSTTFIR